MDVIEIARDKRRQLHAELGRIDEFIRMAETLLDRARQEGDRNRGPVAVASAEFAKRGEVAR